MAHQIESMFYVGETPWHGLGRVLDEAPSIAAAMQAAGLDWKVNLLPLFTADGKPVPAKATVRETDGSILGVVGDRYHVLQNTDAFNFFDPLVSSGLVKLETAGSLSDGKRVWVLARIADNSDLKIIGDDIVRKFIMLSNSHDGTTSVRVGFTPVRIVCANTLAAAHQSGASQLIRLKHSSSVVANLDALRDVINIANQSFEASAEQYRALAARKINADDLRKYVKIVLGHAETKDDDLSARAKNQIERVITLAEYGRGTEIIGVKGTAWAAYNAVTEFFTHEVTDDTDKRYSSLWFGNNAVRNTAALTEALKLAA